MNCLFLLLPVKLHFLAYILLLPGNMFVSFCSYMVHLCLFFCCLLFFCCGFLLLFQCLSCSCSLILSFFLFKCLFNLLFSPKCLFIIFRNFLPMFVFTDLQYGALNHIIFLFLFLFLHSSV